MADYYNRTTSPLPVSLLNGRSGCLPPKTWTTLAPEDEGSESIARLVASGDLVRRVAPVVPPAPAAAPAAPVQPVAAPAPAPSPAPVTRSLREAPPAAPVASAPSASDPLQAPTDGSMSAASSRPARAKKE